jgi:hypothetical protein
MSKKSIIISVVIIIIVGVAGYFLFGKVTNYRPPLNTAWDENPIKPISKNVNVAIATEISKNILSAQQTENRLSWERQDMGSLKVSIPKSDTSSQYFLPGTFICIPNEDKPVYLTLYINDKIVGAGGGLITLPAGEAKEYTYSLILSPSSFYIKDFNQYSAGVYKDYARVDYSQKGFDVGGYRIPLSVTVYSNDKQLSTSIHCNNLGTDGITRIKNITIE